MTPAIKPVERTAILQALRAGMVPRIGIQHLQVGRLEEVKAVIGDLDQIEQGGSAVRFIIGRFGSGKSFFLNLCRATALAKRFVVAQADITPDRRLQGSGGQARSLYAELLKNLSTKAKPEGGALSGIVERWISDLQHEVKTAKGTDSDLSDSIHERLKPLQEFVSGHDFATVIEKYLEGFLNHNDQLTTAALRWLRGEYSTKTEARHDLGVRSIIEDATIYDHLKLMAVFVRLAGYPGLLVSLDEMGVLSHRLNHASARSANYEAILRIVNDCIGGGQAAGIGFYFAGIDGFVEDHRRGLFSYEALRTRLEDTMRLRQGLKDFSGPVIRLSNLSADELFVLLHRIRDLSSKESNQPLPITDDDIRQFMTLCSRTLGANFFQTPREVIRPFARMLSILSQNPGATWQSIMTPDQFEQPNDPDAVAASDSDNSTTPNEVKMFRL